MPLSILIAEDYQDLAITYRHSLEDRGHIVTTVRDGLECLRLYSESLKNKDGEMVSSYDVVILDQQMPGMDGIDVAKEIQMANPKQRIIFITGYGEQVIKKLRGLSETVEFMNKPFSLQALAIQVEGWSIYQWREMRKRGFKDWDGWSGTSVPVGPSRTG